MVVIIFIIAAAVLLFMDWGLFGLLGIGLLAAGNASAKKNAKQAEANAPAILDATFDGTENVVFKINMQTLKYETVVIREKDRGYRLLSEANGSQSGIAKT